VKKQLSSLVESLRGSLSPTSFSQIFAACSAWVKLENEGTCQNPENTLEEFVDREILSGYLMANDNVQIENSWVEKLKLSLEKLLSSGVINYQDLSESINELIEPNGKSLGELAHPKEVIELGGKLLNSEAATVYCPFTSGYAFAHKVASYERAVCETLNMTDAFFGRVHNLLLDQNVEIVLTDPIKMPTQIGEGGLQQFDSAIAFPPFGLKYGKDEIHDIWSRFPETSLMGDVYQLRHMLAHSDFVVSFVTSGFLFRTAAGEKQFKHDILENNWLKAVVALPSHLLSTTSIPINIVIFDKSKTDSGVLFVDASGDYFLEQSTRIKTKLINIDKIVSTIDSNADSTYSKYCTVEDIQSNDFNLSPNRYIQSEEAVELSEFLSLHQIAKLTDVADIIRPQAVKHNDGGTVTLVEHNLTSLNEIGQLIGEGKTIKITETQSNKVFKQTIKPGDVLVSCRGAVGRIALVSHEVKENTLASQAFAIVRIKSNVEGVTSESLYQYLISHYGQLTFAGLVTGTTAQMLNAKDLGNMQVPLFEQEKLDELHLIRLQTLNYQKKINELKDEMSQLNSSWI
jgi:type I restriction enzyme M protein